MNKQDNSGYGCLVLLAMIFVGALAIAVGLSFAWGIVIGIGVPIIVVIVGFVVNDTIDRIRRNKRRSWP